MKLIDPSTGEMQCKVCGSNHIANIKPDSNGQFYRGAWQCANKCQLPDPKNDNLAFNGWANKLIPASEMFNPKS